MAPTIRFLRPNYRRGIRIAKETTRRNGRGRRGDNTVAHQLQGKAERRQEEQSCRRQQ